MSVMIMLSVMMIFGDDDVSYDNVGSDDLWRGKCR